MLTKTSAKKYYPKKDGAQKVYMKQPRKHFRSTKVSSLEAITQPHPVDITNQLRLKKEVIIGPL